MKKRIFCAILTLILLVSLVPAGALTASAAGRSVGETAVTILKQLQGYTEKCSAKGYTGYGTKCTEKGTHGNHVSNETVANLALREELKEIDKAVNNFASANGLSLRQNQHDALVLFSFRNGTAWMVGTSDVKSAVTSRATGNEFLNMFCNWRSDDYDNHRRYIEANMYLNNVYSSTAPASYIKVSYDPNGGKLPGNKLTFYYDLNESDSILPTPTRDNATFMGWYNMTEVDDDHLPHDWVHKLRTICDGLTLTAYWQKNNDKAGAGTFVPQPADYTFPASLLASNKIFNKPGGEATGEKISGDLHIVGEYVDKNNVKWAQIDKAGSYSYVDKNDETQTKKNYTFTSAQLLKGVWVKVGVIKTAGVSTAGDGSELDITVTVTNTYVNARDKASIYGGLRGTYNQGTKLRIVGKPVSKSGFLWGQVAKSATDATPVAWVALMYTDYESVIAKVDTSNVADNSTIVAKAHITSPVNGYVNVRSGAGTNHTIVGSVSYGTMVDIYETEYVNGHLWGRCSQGWFALSYAEVTRLVEENPNTQLGFTSYAFTGKIGNIDYIYTSPTSGTAVNLAVVERDFKKADKVSNGKTVTVTNITQVGDDTWGKIAQGWIVLTRNGVPNNFTMDPAKYEVTAATATVREDPNTAASRIDTLSKGTEFDVTKIVADATTIWGYADKVGEDDNKTYSGWVNLSGTYVKRNNAPIITEEDESAGTGMIATIINAEMVNVRNKPSVYGGQVCKIPMGTTAEILSEDDGWYKLRLNGREGMDTWVYGQYVSAKEASSETNTSTGSGKIETGNGIIANTYAGVNVRQTPGIGGAFVGKILPGTAVQILEVEQVGASKWGRVTQGWICMDYVAMMNYQQIPGANNSGNAGGNTVTAAQPAIYTGTVATSGAAAIDAGSKTGTVDENGREVGTSNLIVFKSTDINSDTVRKLQVGDPVTVHEILTVKEEYEKETTTEDNQGSETQIIRKTTYWARVNDGYIRSPGNNIALDTLDEATYTLVNSESLNVYTDHELTVKMEETVTEEDFNGTRAVKLKKGDQVTVTRVVIVNNNVHGQIEFIDGRNGFVNLSKLSKGAITVQTETQPTTPAPTNPTPTLGSNGNTGNGGFVNNAGGYKYTGTVINTNQVNVRATPSTAADITANLKSGTSLVVYETYSDGVYAWGRCDAGWVYLYYVDMVPAGGNAIDAKVVYNDNTIAYTDSSCTEVAGTYAKAAVVDIYEVVGKLARTDLGWVNTDNLLS